MKPIHASGIGIVLAAGLALAVTADTPEDVVARLVEAWDERAITETWQNWHPAAVHKITIKYGPGQQDDTFSYAVADYTSLPDLTTDPDMAETLRVYEEVGRSESEISSVDEQGGTRITAITRVDYNWQTYKGTMLQTDEFFFVSYLGRPMIRSLTTTFDYR